MLCSGGVVQILPAKPVLAKMNLVLIVLATALPSVKISFAVLYRRNLQKSPLSLTPVYSEKLIFVQVL